MRSVLHHQEIISGLTMSTRPPNAIMYVQVVDFYCVKLIKCSRQRLTQETETEKQVLKECLINPVVTCLIIPNQAGVLQVESVINQGRLSILVVHKKTTCGFSILVYDQSRVFFPLRSRERRSCVPDWLSFSCSFLARSKLKGLWETRKRRR